MNSIASFPPSLGHATTVDARYEAAMFDYASGALPAGPAFVVAAHMALRPDAKRMCEVFDAAGGSLLDDLDPVTMGQPTWLMSDMPAPTKPVTGSIDMAHVLASFDQGRWKRNLAGMLVKPVPGVDAQLLKLEAGRSVPHHGHNGLELTLVLSGSFGDGNGTYRRGDLVVQDQDSEHQPCAVANSDCICLISQTAPVRLKGVLGWLINRVSA